MAVGRRTHFRLSYCRGWADQTHSDGSYSTVGIAPTIGPKGMYTAGNRAYFYTGKGSATGDYLWCYERETIAGLARGGGFEAAEASGTVATVVGATSTTGSASP